MYEHLIPYVDWAKKRYVEGLIKEEQTQQAQMEQLAFFDSLTGLKNRGCFEKDCARYSPTNLTVIFIDANELKATNDTYGHQMGDELLKCISASIQQIWSKEYAYRVGGDEFWIMLQDVDDDMAGDEIKRFRDELEKCDVEGRSISVAIGVAKGGADKTIEQLIEEADLDMYKDKRKYKEIHSEENVPTVGTTSQKRRRALENNNGIMLLNDIFRCAIELFVLGLMYVFIN